MKVSRGEAAMKTCSKCAETKGFDEFYRCDRSPDGYEWRCKRCKIASAAKSQKQNSARINKRNRQRAKRPDVRAYNTVRQKDYRAKNPNIVRQQRRSAWISLVTRRANDQSVASMYRAKRARNYAKRIDLSDQYIKECLVQKTSLSFADIPGELIEAKRQQLKVHRLIKQKEKSG